MTGLEVLLIGLVIGLVIILVGAVILRILDNREVRRRIFAAKKEDEEARKEAEEDKGAAAQLPPTGTVQWYPEEAKKLRKQTEQLRAKQSPISSSPEASTALGERLDMANARADYLDALLDAQEEVISARERAEILEAENRLKELKSRGASAKEIQEAENQLTQLREAARQRRKGGTKQT